MALKPGLKRKEQIASLPVINYYYIFTLHGDPLLSLAGIELGPDRGTNLQDG